MTSSIITSHLFRIVPWLESYIMKSPTFYAVNQKSNEGCCDVLTCQNLGVGKDSHRNSIRKLKLRRPDIDIRIIFCFIHPLLGSDR
jgi:hypothetical protein